MRMWLKIKEFWAPAQYKDNPAMLELEEHHKDMKMEFWDTRDNIVASFHETTDTITIKEPIK